MINRIGLYPFSIMVFLLISVCASLISVETANANYVRDIRHKTCKSSIWACETEKVEKFCKKVYVGHGGYDRKQLLKQCDRYFNYEEQLKQWRDDDTQDGEDTNE